MKNLAYLWFSWLGSRHKPPERALTAVVRKLLADTHTTTVTSLLGENSEGRGVNYSPDQQCQRTHIAPNCPLWGAQFLIMGALWVNNINTSVGVILLFLVSWTFLECFLWLLLWLVGDLFKLYKIKTVFPVDSLCIQLFQTWVIITYYNI